MKFNCDYMKQRRRARRESWLDDATRWHTVFAILPTKVAEGDCRCLETVERRALVRCSRAEFIRAGVVDRVLVGLWDWEYRSVSR